MRLPWIQDRIERRAAGIEDPLERLRYLRQSAGRTAKPIRLFKWQISLDFWKTRRTWIVAGLAAITIIAWRPGHSISARAAVAKPAPPPPLVRNRPVVTPSIPAPNSVWLVETHDGVENYSNGLRIDNKYAVANEPREKYAVYGYTQTGLGVVDWRTKPSGIVYHTTESLLAPFEPGQNRWLVRIGSQVLEYVKSKRCYHFVIDRFGRVFRVVNESDRANHAGNSIWGDDKGAYVNLNDSFIGISFESATGNEDHTAPIATPAQIHSGRVLTEMLRAKYSIPAADCVTHGQVSVNPLNMLVGYHTDWGGSFPFAEMGLSDNYGIPPAALFSFGFGYDDTYIKIAGTRVWQSLLQADDQIRHQASNVGMPPSRYRASLQHRYREITAALKSKSPEEGEK